MASVCNRPNGMRWIQFVGVGGKRQTLRLGKVTSKDAAEICRRVEMVLAARIAGTSLDRETASWLTEIGDKLRNRLAALGLIDKPASDSPLATLGAFLADYMATRTDIKPSTRVNLERARDNLLTFFGPNKPLAAITAGDADEFRLWLRRSKPAKPGEPMPPALADNTARRTCGRAKQFFEAARKKKLIAESPFANVGDCQVRANKARDRFVTREEAKKVLDACHCTQWQLVFALSRYGGLRCPSEHALLRWADIDWANNRFTVHSPKTEHHDGHASRVVPIFAELRPYLEAARAESPKDAEYVFTLKGMIRNRLTGKSANVGTTMAKFVKRAGLTPWSKLFQNLRSSRQTELEAQGFPSHVVCAWLGNSPKVAREHYLRVTESDFQKATATAAEKSDAKSEAVTSEKATQNAKLHTAATMGTLGNVVQKCLEANGFGDAFPAIRDLLTNLKAPPVGLECTLEAIL